jgi:short-subunit dehydrogenase
VDVNLLAVAHGSRLFGQAMVDRGEGGQIVNTASAAAFVPSRSLGAYCATKAAVLMLSQSLRGELGGYGIGVSVVCPGVINTNITRSTRYVGRQSAEEERMREQMSRLYARRNFTAERVAAEVLRAIGEDRAVAPISPEAKAMELIGRLTPRLARLLASYDALPV